MGVSPGLSLWSLGSWVGARPVLGGGNHLPRLGWGWDGWGRERAGSTGWLRGGRDPAHCCLRALPTGRSRAGGQPQPPVCQQSPFHFHMERRSSLETLVDVLVSVLQANDWQETNLVLCHPWDISGFLSLWARRSQLFLRTVLDLGYLDEPGAARYLRQHGERFRALSSPVLVLGCDLRRARLIFQAAKESGLLLQEFHWVLGSPLSAGELQTEGLPLGLLAYGEVDRPPLELFIQDAVELVSRAIASAARVRPDLALLQTTVNCNDRHRAGGESSGLFLSR